MQLCPGRPRLQDPLPEYLVSVFAFRFLNLAAYHLQAVRRHEVCVAFAYLVDADHLEPALRVVASAEMLHLREDFDHGCETENGCLFGVGVDETLAEAATVG